MVGKDAEYMSECVYVSMCVCIYVWYSSNFDNYCMPKQNGASLKFYTCNSISFDRKWVLELKFCMVGKDAEHMYEFVYVCMCVCIYVWSGSVVYVYMASQICWPF